MHGITSGRERDRCNTQKDQTVFCVERRFFILKIKIYMYVCSAGSRVDNMALDTLRLSVGWFRLTFFLRDFVETSAGEVRGPGNVG